MKFEKQCLIVCFLMALGGAAMQAFAQRTSGQERYVSADDSGDRSDPATRRADSDNPRTTDTEPLNSCGDSLAVALQQGTPEFLCWATIRPAERWNSASIVSGLQPGGDPAVKLPQYGPSTTFTATTGGFSGQSLPDQSPGKAYGGLAAGSLLVERRRWQFMAEDGGGLADLHAGKDYLVGLNRAAMRATGEIDPRWSWQGTATSTYGTDAARIVAPLDFRRIGDAEAPAADTVVYGLHGGRVTTGEEGLKLRFVGSRRSFWDFSGTHTYTQYNADKFLVQTARTRVEYVYAMTPTMGIGVYGNGEHQTGPLDCSLGGAGLRWLAAWGTRASLNVAGGLSGGGASCGRREQTTGSAALYLRLAPSTDLYLSAGRDLSDGIFEHAVFLSTGAAGIRHSLHRIADVRVSWNGLQGVDPVTRQSYHGMFADGSLHFKMGLGFSQELEIRQYSIAGTPNNDRTIAVGTLWWSPGRTSETASVRAPLR